ncbi:MAG TPA: divalent-cation tolerance protein CutA [Thermoanaerobaculia bacterium]|jgi:periplasmic divalent cation tolerance protein|nr:divalent-cation tolerance protein CutA [Thermoanaerobaculia bacterium]
MTPVIVLTSVAADFDARPLARELVGMRLVACVNIVSGVLSIFRWKGAIEEDGEQLLVIKTVDDNVEALRKELFARHPYEVPEFLVLPVASTSDTYGAWLAESISR